MSDARRARDARHATIWRTVIEPCAACIEHFYRGATTKRHELVCAHGTERPT